MKKIFERTVIYSLVLFSGIVLGVVIRNNDKTWAVFAKSSVTAELESDDSTKAEWILN